MTGAVLSPSSAAASTRLARDQLAVLSHETGHRPAELRHAGGDLRDLVGPVRLGVPNIGLEALERPRLDALRGEAQGHSRILHDRNCRREPRRAEEPGSARGPSFLKAA